MFSVLSQIRERFEYMTPVEQRIANFMLDNPTKVINMPVKDIARNSDTSDAAIVRFSKRIGLAGIKELKVELAKELHTLEKENISRVIELEQDTHKDIFDKVFKNTIQALYNTEKIVNRKAMKETAHLFAKSENTFIFGVGDSANVGNELEQKLHRVNINAFFTADKYLCMTRLSNAKENDVLFLITLSGKTKEVVEVVKLAKKLGVKTVILTQNHASIAKRNADIAIEITEEETNIQYMNMTSRIAQLVICDVLFFYICRELGASAYDTIIKTYDVTH